LKDGSDDVEEGAKNGFGTRLDLLVGDGFNRSDEAPDGAKVEMVERASLTQAQLSAVDTATDFGVNLHADVHSCLPCSRT
jgi:hypothetical protein